jgi:hypothetical protein
MRLAVETCTCICIHSLQKAIKKIINRDYPESTMEELYEHTLEELRKFSVNDQVFEYESMDGYLGGYRWFFLCPKCKKRSSKLFLPPLWAKNRERLYACKICHRLRNLSSITGMNSTYQKITRPLRRIKEIEDKISKGHLASEKIQELLNEYEALEQQLKSSPEYHLYSFKKIHNLERDNLPSP